jgi:hypothetical protein
MRGLKGQLGAAAKSTCLLVGSALVSRTQGVRAQETGTQGATLLDGLKVTEPAAEPMKIQANIASYRGRRAVRVVNAEGQDPQTGAQVLTFRQPTVQRWLYVINHGWIYS